MSLRKALIRLAHANPDLRADLLPLLKNAAKYPKVVRDIEADFKRQAITRSEREELLRLVEEADTEKDAQKAVDSHRKGRTASELNPKPSLWSKEDRTFAIKMNTRKGENLWMGDGWKHSMDLSRDESPKTYPSEVAAKNGITKEVLPYIKKWQSGWEDFVKGWQMPG